MRTIFISRLQTTDDRSSKFHTTDGCLADRSDYIPQVLLMYIVET